MATATASDVKRWASSPEVREWALTLTDTEKKRYGIDGLEVSEKGRFHSAIVRAFNHAHRKENVAYVPISRNSPRLDEVFQERYNPDDVPEVTRQEQPKEQAAPPKAKHEAEPQAAQPMVMAMGNAPEPIMELLRAGQNVIVVYVPLPVNAA